MTEVLTSAQMRALEARVIGSGQVSGLSLMERAGRGALEAILARWPDLGPDRALVLCGPGNNGGDGFVIARLLTDLGWAVEVLFYGDAARLPPDARANHDRWAQMRPVQQMTGDAKAFDPPPDLWVDAVFGIGQTRALPPPVGATLRRVAAARARHAAPVVAVDLPTGLNADTGAALDPDMLAADLTVTFHSPKPGHLQGDGPGVCGRLVVVDIGLSQGGAP